MSVSGPRPRPRRATVLALALGVSLGAAAGLGGYTFVYARGSSYLTDDPRACANCHVMQEQYDGWTRASHRAVATCNSCHTPHDFLGKWFTKARNGFHHGFAFTTGRFAEPIRITEGNRRVTEGTCRSCHADLVRAIDTPGSGAHASPDAALRCATCHRSVGHLH